ncbi:MAG: Outer membrane efflux protein BepC precursor [Syntrophus sp. PtaB.Bin001]|nr:MAG: Outer membrane efflux protein BepC precursor [Syntrophus sp. PtaB.Bin001]OPY91550.1 MAG: Outer membrane efflux protein BepC precursor [Syntrophus sp. PtaU1.Bin208]
MNASRKGISAAIVIFILICRVAPVFGFDLQYPLFDDPLFSKPDVIEKGVILPGDTAPIACLVSKDFSSPLTLSEAVDIALCNNPQIRSSWANIRVRAAAVGEARAAYLPALNGALNRTKDRIDYSDSRYPDSDIYRTTFQGGLSWRILDFGGRGANRRAANALLAAALASHNATLQKALSDVAQAYFDAMTAKAALKAAIEGKEIAQATLNSAKAREEKGAISRSDRLRATTALASAILESNRAQSDYRKALAVLGQILGVPGNTVISIPEDLAENAGKISKDLNDWLEEAQRNHPAIVAAREQLKAAQNQVAVVRSAGLPTLNFSANYYKNTKPGEAVTQTEATETTVGIGVNIPLFDGFSNTYKIRGAQAQVEQKKAALADTENSIALDLIKAYVDATSALKNIDASADLLKAAQEALAVSQRRYDKGAADITEILNTQSALSGARHERIRCLAEWHSARLRLLASAGKMGRLAATGEK